MNMRLNIIGNFFGTSGFASHIRQLANALHEQGVEVRVDCPKPQGWELTVNDAELLMLNREYNREAVSILIGQPQFLPFVWADNPKTVIPFVIWEGSNVPRFWLKFLLDERIQQIWCPSEHTAKAILNTVVEPKTYGYLKSKIRIVPHGVDINLFNQDILKRE